MLFIVIIISVTLAVVQIGFEFTEYEAVEGEPEEVCVLLIAGTLERDVTVTVTSLDQSATGKAASFSVLLSSVTVSFHIRLIKWTIQACVFYFSLHLFLHPMQLVWTTTRWMRH